ncbi:hypothetical protein Aperf_G00000103280 [Anoplocephala perfoliata]
MFSIPWVHIKPLILLKFNLIMDEFIEDVDENVHQRMFQPTEVNSLRDRVYKILSQLEGTPFTIQRICELLTDPRKNYTRPEKFLRGFEKVCLVVSTVDAYGNKIHYVEPRLSGNIERSTPVVLNGSSGDSGPGGSGEESSIGSKRWDGEEEDADNMTTRRPCINFYRRSSSKLVEGLKNSFGDGLLGAYSPGIPGKHTLQRPFLSSRSSISFNTIFEEAENSATTADDGDDVGEIKQERQEGETSVEEADVEGAESRTAHTSEFLSSQSTHPLTGIQKLFMETEEEETNKLTTIVPPIDQMLRPMGQLEAFVNTISMVTATPSVTSATSGTSAVMTEPVREKPSPEEVEAGSGGDGPDPESKQEEEVGIPVTEIQPPKEEASDEVNSKEADATLTDSSSNPTRSSLKRDSKEDASVTLASPAKRPRLDAKRADKSESDDEFSGIYPAATSISMEYEKFKEDSKESAEKSPNETQFSGENSASKHEAVEAPNPESQEEIPEEDGCRATVDSDTGEKEVLK